MTDTAEPQGLPPINLHANSYNLQKLEAASKRAEDLKTEDGTLDALASIPDKLAENQAVLENKRGIAVPEHHKLATITDAQGNKVEAPVPVLKGKEAEAAEADAQEAEEIAAGQIETTNSRRRGQADAGDASTDKASS